MKKSNQYTVRLDPAFQEEFEKAMEITGMDAQMLLKACIKAFIEEVHETGEIRLPLAVIPKKSIQRTREFEPRMNEEPASQAPAKRKTA